MLWGELRYRLAEKKQKPVAISGLIDSLTFISSLVTQAIQRLDAINRSEKVGFPNYTLDSISLIRHLDKTARFLPKQTLSDVDGLRYQIEHADNKMQMLYSIVANDGIDKARAHPEFASLLEHLKKVNEWILERKKEIEKIV